MMKFENLKSEVSSTYSLFGNGNILPELPQFKKKVVQSDFYVNSPTVRIDKIVKSCVNKLSEGLEKLQIPLDGNDISKNIDDWKLEERLKEANQGAANAVKQKLITDGYSSRISEVSKKLRSSNIDHSEKYLLSFEPVYVYALSYSIYFEGVTDVDGIFSRVLKVNTDIIRKYTNQLVTIKMVEEEHLDIFENDIKKEKILLEASNATFSYLEGKVVNAIECIIYKFTNYGRLFDLVNSFFEKSSPEIDRNRGTKEIKELMVKYLMNIGVIIPDSYNITPGSTKYDEYLAVAYTSSLKQSLSSDDPITNIFTGSGPDSFNYEVDYFETTEDQGVDPENILAAGTLFYVKTLTDDMMILPVTDAIIMRWTAGMLDIPQGKTATNLYRFFKLKEDRVKKAESDLFLKTVFNAGDGEVLDNMSVNRDFPQLWNTLLEEVVKYIDKYEQKDSAFDVVSKSAIFQSIRDLQYNLTVFTSGMVKAILPEMYKQLEHAISILDDDNVKNQLGRGYRRSMWNVIERISMEEFNYAPNVSAYRTIAVNGHKIFTTIASFNESLISEEEFRTFIHNVEEFIIAQSQVGEKPDIGDEDDEGMPEDDEAVMDEIEKDDWDF